MIPKSTLFSIDDFVASLQSMEKTVQADMAVPKKENDCAWKIEEATDGRQYLVRNDPIENGLAKAGWSAAVNRTGDMITLAYQGVPVKRFAQVEFPFESSKATVFASFLVEKACSDPKFVPNLLKVVPFEQRVALQKRFAIFRQGQ